MVSDNRLDELRRKIMKNAPEPTWQKPEDLARISMEAFVGQTLGRELRSRGRLHLTGSGVEGNSAPMVAVAQVMATMQRLVSACGAYSEGITASRGRIPDLIERRTRLSLNASPRPGSIILDMVPSLTPTEELYPDSQVPLGDDRTQLADVSVTTAMDLLSAGINDDVVADDFADLISDRGPRVASSLRDLVDSFSRAAFDADLSWEQPECATRRVSITKTQSERISSVIKGRDLDVETVTISGVARTLSDMQPLRIETGDSGIVSVTLGKISGDHLTGIEVGDTVSLVVEARVTLQMGGDTTQKYRGLSIQRLD